MPENGSCPKSLEGTPGALSDVIVHRGRRCCRRGRLKERLQIALRLREPHDPHRVGDVRIASAAGPDRGPESATEDHDRGVGNDSKGRRADFCCAPVRREAPAVDLGGACTPVLAVDPARSVREGEERQPVVDQGRPAVGRGGNCPLRALLVVPGPAGLSDVRGEGREPVIGLRALPEEPGAAHDRACVAVVRVAGDGESLATLARGSRRAGARRGEAYIHPPPP